MKHIKLFEEFSSTLSLVNEAKFKKQKNIKTIMKHLQLFEQFLNEQSVPKKFGSEEQFVWKDVEQKLGSSFIGTFKHYKYNDMKVPFMKLLFIETFDVLTKKFGYEDHHALNFLNKNGSSISYYVINNHDGVDGKRRYAQFGDALGKMEEIMLGLETSSTWKKLAKDFDTK